MLLQHSLGFYEQKTFGNSCANIFVITIFVIKINNSLFSWYHEKGKDNSPFEAHKRRGSTIDGRRD